MCIFGHIPFNPKIYIVHIISVEARIINHFLSQLNAEMYILKLIQPYLTSLPFQCKNYYGMQV